MGKFFLTLILIGAGAGYYYLDKYKLIEQDKPTITIDKKLYWNLKDSLKADIYDEGGIRFIKASLTDKNGKSVVVAREIFHSPVNKFELKINAPKSGFFAKDGKIKLAIEVVDSSLWNMLEGNRATKEATVTIDTKKPKIKYLTSSYSIVKGGSSLVIFGAKDKNLHRLYIETNFGKKFYPVKFYKNGYFASLVAWPLDEKKFSANIVAVDRAGNRLKQKARLYLINKTYRDSTLALKDNFLNGKIDTMAQRYKDDYKENEKIKNFAFINETLRDKDENALHEKTLIGSRAKIDKFDIKKFYPLKNAAAVASFGDHRFYKKNEKIVSTSYHLGLDLASIKNDNIITNNDGKVVFLEERGIYGNSVIIDHGLGLHTLYSHCNSFEVELGDEVKAGQVIAKTGMTGLALGDHLHFGVLVQGVEVRPAEWMDASWIRKNITSIINGAKHMIDNKKGDL